jgi:hypothetical protein
MRRIIAAIALCSLGATMNPVGATAADEVSTVVALIDTGINPYSPVFRDTSARALQHPSTYLDGYPTDAIALDLTLDVPLAEALAADDDTWRLRAFQNVLYYVPGTRIVGLIMKSPGGVDCENGAPSVPPAGIARSLGCRDRRLLDDAGHGTMTASRSTGIGTSLGEGSFVVMVEGLGAASVTWAASQPWIDIQSNSWGSLVPNDQSIRTAFHHAAEKQMVFAASGNGLALGHGFAPQPTYGSSTAPPGVIVVGAHDNGKVAAWSSAPAHVVADGYGGPTGFHNTNDAARPAPISCCTSAAAPYAAGGAAAILREARTLLGDSGVGLRGDAIALGSGAFPATSPLHDGKLTLAELRDLVLKTAEARPTAGAHDGLLHFTGGPGVPQNPQHGPGENPYCEGCWTLPVAWTEVPSDVPSHLSIGDGAVNERSVALARAVLAGTAPLPTRAVEDAFFAQDDAIRSALYGG